MLKQSTAVAILVLTMPTCASASDDGSLQNFLNGSSNSLRGVDTQGKKYNLSGLKEIRTTGTSLGGAQANPHLPVHPFNIFGKAKECDGKSVPDFMSGKCNKLYGIDSPRYLHQQPNTPPAWGADEFVDSEGFTQSGAPYQQFNPYIYIDQSKPHTIKRIQTDPTSDDLKKPQKFFIEEQKQP